MRRAVVTGLAVGLGILVVADAIFARSGLVGGVIPRADGPWLWTISRAAGAAAFLAVTLEVVLGLLLSTRAIDRWVARGPAVAVHRWLSVTALWLVGLHAVSLAGDRFVRFDVLDAMVPFLAPYRPLAVGLGVLAAWAAIAVHGSFALRARLGPGTWRRLHRLSFLVFVLAVAHALLAGTDASRPAMSALVLGSAVVVTGLLALRLARAHCTGRHEAVVITSRASRS